MAPDPWHESETWSDPDPWRDRDHPYDWAAHDRTVTAIEVVAVLVFVVCIVALWVLL